MSEARLCHELLEVDGEGGMTEPFEQGNETE